MIIKANEVGLIRTGKMILEPMYKVIEQRTANHDQHTYTQNTTSSTGQLVQFAQRDNYYYFEVIRLSDNKVVFMYTDNTVFEVVEDFKQYIEEGDVKENMITLKGTKEEVVVLGENDMLSREVITALNENYILEDIVANGEVELKWLNGGFNYIDINSQEYLVIEGDESATLEAIERAEDIILDCDISDNLLDIAYLNNYIDTNWFVEYWQELHENMSYNEGIEYIATEDELEQLEEGEISEDEIREQYYNSLQSSIEGSEIEEFKYQFGDEYFNKVLLDEELIDIKAIATYCVEVDGRGHYLSSYDGEEIQQGELFLYRIN